MRALTRCLFSPFGKGLTTKAPVRLCLKPIPDGAAPSFEVNLRGDVFSTEMTTEADIAPLVEGIMESLIPANTLTEDEVTVTICKPGIPSLVFIDLPGIRVTDPDSEKLAKKFIQDPNNLVICLVEATFISLTSHTAVKLVREHGRVRDTLLVLTRSDQVLRLGDQCIKGHLLDRVLNRSEEMKAIGFDSAQFVFADCPDRPAQSSHADYECDLYEHDIISRLQAPYSADIEVIRQHCTMQRLIGILVSRYEEFLCREGVPTALHWLQPKLDEAREQIRALGLPVSQLTLQQVMQAALAACDFQSVFSKLHKEFPGGPALAISLDLGHGRHTTLARWAPALQLQPPALAYYEQQAWVTTAVLQAITHWLVSKPHVALVENMLRRAFASSGPLCLERFESLLAALLDGRLADAIDMEEVTRLILALPTLQRLKCGSPDLSRPGVLAAIDVDNVRAPFIHLVVQPMRDPAGPLARCIEAGFPLVESDSFQEKRRSAEAHKQVLEKAIGLMEVIRDKYPQAPATHAAQGQVG